MIGEKFFLHFVRIAHEYKPEDSTSYGYVGALDRRLGYYGDWIVGFLAHVRAYRGQRSPTMDEEASPPMVCASSTCLAILLTMPCLVFPALCARSAPQPGEA